MIKAENKNIWGEFLDGPRLLPWVFSILHIFDAGNNFREGAKDVLVVHSVSVVVESLRRLYWRKLWLIRRLTFEFIASTGLPGFFPIDIFRSKAPNRFTRDAYMSSNIRVYFTYSICSCICIRCHSKFRISTMVSKNMESRASSRFSLASAKCRRASSYNAVLVSRCTHSTGCATKSWTPLHLLPRGPVDTFH